MTETLDSLRRKTCKRKVTLLFASKEPRLNNVFALKQFLEARARGGRSRSGGRR